MLHAVKPIPFKPHQLSGLSEQPMIRHYEEFYGGCVRRANSVEQRLAALDRARTPAAEIYSLKRDQMLALNAKILHEVYFDSLGGSGQPEGELAAALAGDFGSLADWRTEFLTMAAAQSEQHRSGWVVLSWLPAQDHDQAANLPPGRLLNQSTDDDGCGLSGATPLLAIDLHEHAYRDDFGTDTSAYSEAFLSNIQWAAAGARYVNAAGLPRTSETPQAVESVTTVNSLRAQLDNRQPMQVLDVRLRDDLARSDIRIPDARWRDPEQVADWADTLDKSKPVVVYCVYGFWVSQDTTAALRERGFDAHTLAGGIAAWRASGEPTEALERS